ncbi:serine/threonine-protein kinase [Plectonema radiosum]|uniref:serine/threonine-protein kinase n=1 Tax=Plectonema radiosum TaxID=945768 RepID=UPI002981D42E|nr:serine/threonine-protein kinase [Plectonema radiosum]
MPLLRNRFRVIRVLSDEGGFGRTYLSEDIDKLNERCVIKQLAPKFQGSWAQKKAMELFQAEAKRLQELGEHPQIPTLLAYFEQDGCLYLVQQFIDGHNLLKELQLRKGYNYQEIKQILIDLLSTLKFIHDRGVIHRDIKPENIIRCQSDGRLNLIDFGSSKQLTARVQNKIGTSIGSHGYSPIEQIRDGKAYPSSDLFGLGATCFHLLTGISPFQLWMEYGYGWVTDWRQYLKSPISNELDWILDKLLKKEVQQRYQSVDEVLRDFTEKQLLQVPAANRYSAVEPPPTQTPSLPKQYVVLRNLFLTGGVILLLGLGDVWYKQSRRLESSLSSSLNQRNINPDSREAILRHPSPIGFGNFSNSETLNGFHNSVLSVAISPDGNTIASNSDRAIKVRNLATGEEIYTLIGHSNRVNVLAISPDGQKLVSGSEDNTIKVWNLNTGRKIRTLVGHSDSVHALAITTDGKTLVDGSDDNTIKVWNLDTGRQIRTLKGHSFWVRSVAISPNGKILASGSFDNTIKLWHLETGEEIRTLIGHSQTVTSVAISPDGKMLASGSFDQTIKLWNLDTGKQIRTMKGHSKTVTSLAFSADGKTLVSGSFDQTIKLWNLDTGKQIRTMKGHSKSVTSLALSPDGKTLVSGSEDNTIKIWRVSK